MALTVTTTTDLNIRNGGGTNNEIIGGAPSGCSYEVSDVKQDANGTNWYKIGDGYVSGDYCDVSGDGTSTPSQMSAVDASAVNQKVSDENATSAAATGNGIDTSLEGMLSDSIDSNALLEYYKRRVFGMPYQFLASTDIRPDGGNLGRVFTTNILAESPILSILPSKADYLPSLSDENKQKVFQAMLQLANDAVSDVEKKIAEDQISKFQTRYFSCTMDHTEYIKYVNLLCRSSAVFMGIGDRTVPGTETPYSDYNWACYRMSNMFDNSSSATPVLSDRTSEQVQQDVKDAMENPTDTVLSAVSTEQYYVNFFVTPSTSYSESFSNRTEQSQFENLINKGEGMAKELAFLLGANAIDSTKMQQSIVNMTEEVKKAMSGFSLTSGDNILSRLLSDTQTIISGSNIVFPEIYHDSEFSRSYRAEIKLVSPYGDKEAIFLNILVPMMHMLALTVPRQTTVNSYKAPFLIKAHINKWFSCEMGIIDTLEIQKDGWSVDGFPTEVTMSVGFKDLYSALSVSKTDSITSAYMFAQNQALIEYLSVVCGLDMKKSEFELKTKLIRSIANKFPTDIIDYKEQSVREEAARMAVKIFGGMGGGRF